MNVMPSNAVKWVLLSSLCLSALSACSRTAGTNWQGTWEFVNPDTGESVQFILSDDEKVYFLAPEGLSPEKVAYEIPIERVSEETAVPEDTQIISLAEELENNAARAAASEGVLSVSALMSGQQAYYVENEAFTDSFEDLGLSISPDNENYAYAMVLGENNVMITGSAQGDEAKSFTGLVYIDDEGITQGILCETEENSTTAPDMPEISADGATCAAGSVSVQ